MYYLDDLLVEAHITEQRREIVIRLKDLVPIGRIKREGSEAKVSISSDGREFTEIAGHGENKTAGFLKVEGSGECRVRFYVGAGYWASRDMEYTDAFLNCRANGWAGGDGINSFNLSDGRDAYGASKENTLFIFGDTLVSAVNRDCERILPVEMPNNTYALMKGGLGGLEFFVPRNEQGKAEAVLKPAESISSGEEWFWLQDGVVIGDRLFLSPLIMREDDSKPEGFQFQIADVCMVEVQIKNGVPDFIHAGQYQAGLYRRKGRMQYVGGIAYMPYHPDMGYENGDGYIYAYGYISSAEDAEERTVMTVGRVKPQDFKDTSKWSFYNGREFVEGIENSVGVLEHISCEMSVMPIAAGQNRGKFLAIFQYDGQSPYVGYSIGETPWGPFSEPCRVYWCDERHRLNDTIYTYNAKAHSHLSDPSSILVSYNVNTPIMKENYRNADIYHPRFIRLHDTTIKEDACDEEG